MLMQVKHVKIQSKNYYLMEIKLKKEEGENKWQE